MTSRTAQRRRRKLERQAGAELTLAGEPVAVEEQRARELARKLEGAERNLVGWGWTAFHHARQVQVPAELRRGVLVGAGRPGECYELAAAYVVAHADQPVTLVHGWVFENGLPWSHAWVELPGGALWDPTTGRFFDRESFYEVLQALPLARHPAADAAERILAEGSAGPWEEYNRAHDTLVEAWIQHIETAHPHLEAWVDAMLAADPHFAATYRQLVLDNALAALHIHGDLARHPERWQQHRPGDPWPHRVHPLGELERVR